MKKLVFMLTIIGILASCSNDEGETIEIINGNVHVTISNKGNFEYDLGFFGDEEGARISKQATHFEFSELERINAVQLIYKYKALEDFVGTDIVEITTERGSNGANLNTEMVVIKITLNVTE